MVSMERLDVRSIVSGNQHIDTRSDSITSGGSGMLGDGELGGYVEACDGEVSVSAPAQRWRSASDGFRASVRISAYALALGTSSSSKNEISPMAGGGGGRNWERERCRD
jgi:hypothetical protein